MKRDEDGTGMDETERDLAGVGGGWRAGCCLPELVAVVLAAVSELARALLRHHSMITLTRRVSTGTCPSALSFVAPSHQRNLITSPRRAHPELYLPLRSDKPC